jgi:hypothetical protein
VDEGTGRVHGQQEVRADEPRAPSGGSLGAGLDEDGVWAIEDCRAVEEKPVLTNRPA